MLKDTFKLPYIIKITDASPYEVSVGGEHALTVSVVGNSVKKEWAETWANWKELHEHDGLKELEDKCNALVISSMNGMKGQPKGKSKGH